MSSIRKSLPKQIISLVIGALILSGCASTKNPQDPYEDFNRAMFSFNEAADKAILKPVAQGYDYVFPSLVKTGISNFFGNIRDVWTGVNNFLQGNVEAGLIDVTRVTMNTTFGMLGFIDIASEAQLTKHHEDFGQTLGKWGVPAGNYLVLPYFGPSNVRDGLAIPVDYVGDVWSGVEPSHSRIAGTVVRVVDLRADALGSYSLLEDAALDKYAFVREAYTQRRLKQIHGDTTTAGPRPEFKAIKEAFPQEGDEWEDAGDGWEDATPTPETPQ